MKLLKEELIARPDTPDPEAIATQALALSRKHSADVLLLNGDCYSIMETTVLEQLRRRRKDTERPKKLIFVLTTPGGIPETAYRMGRAIQNTYETSDALVGGWCKSAGTLLLISANTLILGDDAELGPLDIQLAKRDELNERDSGLVISEALANLEIYAFEFFDEFMRQIKDKSHGLVTLKTASEISASIAKGLFEPIYRQIDPQKIGEIARSMAVGRSYAQRLNLKPKNLQKYALENLLRGYPSHGFVIDRQEAAELFHRVREPDSEETAFLLELGELAISPSRKPIAMLFKHEEEDHESKRAVTAKKAAKRVQKPARTSSRAR